MRFRFLWVLVIAFVVQGAVLAQDNFISEQRPDAPELAALGEHTIGVRTMELVNPDQIDIVNIDGDTEPTYDRPLTIEVWYPATLADGEEAGGEYVVNTRNPENTATLTGLAVRDADADAMSAPYPLVIISHGYPGNRFLLIHLAENLATKGYVVASIDHTDSTYADQNAFGSTLYNRAIDQHFVIDELIAMSGADDSFLSGMIQPDNVGVIGYSMGGYGALISVGSGLTAESAAFGFATPNELLLDYQLDAEHYQTLLADSPIRAVVAFAPWGMNTGFFGAEGLGNITDTPIMFVAGSQDDVSGYEIGTRRLWEDTINTDRYLLTFENARHNAGAPMPPPTEVTDFNEYMHYADNVWNSARMNNISQHFVTAFLGIHLKGEEYGPYLDVIPNAVDGVYSTDDDGNFTDEHTYWLGFQDRTALGLSLEFLGAGE
ncbi:MAG: dienelactone hydrolase [Chloroflexota bacterium]